MRKGGPELQLFNKLSPNRCPVTDICKGAVGSRDGKAKELRNFFSVCLNMGFPLSIFALPGVGFV